DRHRGEAARHGDHRHGRAAPRAPAQNDFQRHRRLRPEERSLPRHGRGSRAPGSVKAYRTATLALAIVFIGIGIALVIEAAVVGGGLGYLLGLLFVGAGAGRLWILLARRERA